jgi:alpha-beta hydrolase superfamily lysophospholipase
MIAKNTSFRAADGKEIRGYRWSPDPAGKVVGVVQIAHGMAETAVRYARFADFLCKAGYVVIAHDHRGHGTTAGSLEAVGYIEDHDSMSFLVEDMYLETLGIKKEFPGLPVYFLGHSMGSFVGQRYAQLYGNEVTGMILSGTNGKQGLMLKIARIAAASEVKKIGHRTPSPKLDKMSFGSYNKAFAPNRTAFDWLSRDNAEVDKYVDDPYCGGVFSAGFFLDMVDFLIEIEKSKNVRKVPETLPVLMVSGARDPVGRAGKGVKILYDAYRSVNVKDITMKLYPEAHHEILNETNRAEVMSDILAWMQAHPAK